MTNSSGPITTKHILFCRCGGERISRDLLLSTELCLKEQPVAVTCAADLCGLVAQKNPHSDLLRKDTEYLVIGCYKRTMDLLFSGQKLTPGFKHINLIESSEAEVLSRIKEFVSGYQGTASFSEIRSDSDWPSWYPLIDYSRCTDCGQCADFCLFGVYEKNGRVTVSNPQNCKNNCPACARICPVTAIIFPKYKNGGAVGGSDEIDEYAEQKRQAMDMESFLGDDIYSALEKRKIKRQSIIKAEEMKKAVTERDNALNDLNLNLDVYN
jgi:NAD-dependent dihydropyrimidine dehydrogenase PreA subunit